MHVIIARPLSHLGKQEVFSEAAREGREIDKERHTHKERKRER